MPTLVRGRGPARHGRTKQPHLSESGSGAAGDTSAHAGSSPGLCRSGSDECWASRTTYIQHSQHVSGGCPPAGWSLPGSPCSLLAAGVLWGMHKVAMLWTIAYRADVPVGNPPARGARGILFKKGFSSPRPRMGHHELLFRETWAVPRGQAHTKTPGRGKPAAAILAHLAPADASLHHPSAMPVLP